MDIKFLDTAAIIGCYLAIIAHYVWTFKTVSRMREMLYSHENNKSIHGDKENFVRKDVNDATIKRIDDNLGRIDSRMEKVEGKLDKGFADVMSLIRGK